MAAQAQNTGLSKTTTIIIAIVVGVIAFLLRGGTSVEGFDPSKLLDFGLQHDSVIVDRTDRITIGELNARIEAKMEYIDSLEYEYRLLASRRVNKSDPLVIRETVAVQDPALRNRLDSLRFVHDRILREIDSLRQRVILSGYTIAKRSIRFEGDTSAITVDDSLYAIADVTRGSIVVQSTPEIVVHRAQLLVDCGEPWWLKPALVVTAILVREVLPLIFK